LHSLLSFKHYYTTKTSADIKTGTDFRLLKQLSILNDRPVIVFENEMNQEKEKQFLFGGTGENRNEKRTLFFSDTLKLEFPVY